MMRLSYLFIPLLLAGCGQSGTPGPTLVPVTGVLTVGGLPVADVSVQLVPVEATTKSYISAGKTDASGKFTLVANNGKPGAAKGKYRVVLSKTSFSSASAPVGQMSPEDYKKAMGTKGPPSANKQKDALPFPQEYAKAESSPKEVDVADKPLTLELKL